MEPQPPAQRPAPPSFLPRPIDAPTTGADAGPFVQRMALMPFWPALWTGAARWRTGQVVWPLIVLMLLVGLVLSAVSLRSLRPEMQRWARAYDAEYPAVIFENGEARVEGDRVIQVTEGRTTLLVDPNETVPTERITTPEYIVVRKHEIIRKQSFRAEERTPIAGLRPLLGEGPIRIDGNAIRTFDARWGLMLHIGLMLAAAAFFFLKEAIGCTLYSLAAGGIVLGLRGRGLGLGFGACVRVALAVSALTVVVGAALSSGGLAPGLCLGVVLWPVVIAGLALWAVGRA